MSRKESGLVDDYLADLDIATCLGAFVVLIAVLVIIFVVVLVVGLVDSIRARPHLFDSTIPTVNDFPGLKEELRSLSERISLDKNKDIDSFRFHGFPDYKITIEVWPSNELYRLGSEDSEAYEAYVRQNLCPLFHEIVDRYIGDGYDVDVRIDRRQTFFKETDGMLCE